MKKTLQVLLIAIAISALSAGFVVAANNETNDITIEESIEQSFEHLNNDQLTAKRWEMLRDTLQYVIEHPIIDGEHPSIATDLNPPEKKEKDAEEHEIFDFKKFEKSQFSIRRYNNVENIIEYERTYAAKEDIAVLQKESFELLKRFEEMIENDETDYKLCYLTFDDGPYARTAKFLKKLNKYHIQATFFTTSINGQYCFDNSKVKTAPFYREYLKYGHTIGNHTYTHGLFHGLYDSKKKFVKAVLKQEEYVEGLTGYETNIYRFPGGSLTAGNLKGPIIKTMKKHGYGWVDWSAQTGDGGNLKSSRRGMKNYKQSMDSDIEVCLCHDYSKITYGNLGKMIKYARKHNYIFAPLFYDSVMVNK